MKGKLRESDKQKDLYDNVSQIVGPHPSRGERCDARGGTYDPGEQVHIYNFIDHGLSYSE